MKAVKHGHNDTVKTLIAAGADVSVKVGTISQISLHNNIMFILTFI